MGCGLVVWECYIFCEGMGFDGFELLMDWVLVFGGSVWECVEDG